MAASQDRAPEPPAAVASPDRFLVGIVLGAVLLIALGIAVVLLAARAPARPAADPASPAGVVQAYVEALRAGENDRARTYLSQSARDQLDKQGFPRPYHPGSVPERRIVIEPAEVGPDRAHVKVTVSSSSARSEPFSSSTYHNEIDVRLVRESGQWRISTPIEPFPFLY
jgi:hypothetical protein